VLKKNLKNRQTLNVYSMLCLVAAVYFVCFLLLQDDFLPFSIGSVLAKLNGFSKHWHVLSVALLPVYVALVVFGATITGVYLVSLIQRSIKHFLNRSDTV